MTLCQGKRKMSSRDTSDSKGENTKNWTISSDRGLTLTYRYLFSSLPSLYLLNFSSPERQAVGSGRAAWFCSDAPDNHPENLNSSFCLNSSGCGFVSHIDDAPVDASRSVRTTVWRCLVVEIRKRKKIIKITLPRCLIRLAHHLTTLTTPELPLS